MKIALFGKTINNDCQNYVKQLLDVLQQSGIGISIFEPFLNNNTSQFQYIKNFSTFNSHQDLINNTDIVISLGGDGTMLDTISLIRDSNIPIMGINLGRLGFLASISKEMILPAIETIKNGNYSIEKRTLIKIDTDNHPFGEVNYALNEMTVYKKNPMSMITIKVFINDEFLNSYWCDGLLISTPTGSTAYSLSCGGPIITPDSQTFIITPIATHNLTVRPIVIPDSSIIRIKVESRENNYFASLDSRSFDIDSSKELIIKKADFCINLLKMNNQNFFSTIRQKLLWGNDARN
jgi:NAD+ kinase